MKEQPIAELYNACWRATSPSLYPSVPPKHFESSIEKQKEKVIAAAPKKYVPPHARNSQSAAAATPAVVAPIVAVKYTPKSQGQQQPNGPPSKAANRNKKRREKKKQLTGNGDSGGEQAAEDIGTSSEDMTASQGESDQNNIAENTKKAKNIQKKLRQIEQLKNQQAAGKILNADQQSKLIEENKLREQLSQIKI